MSFDALQFSYVLFQFFRYLLIGTSLLLMLDRKELVNNNVEIS